ncbi:MAG: glycoside hydrolase family 88 protein [Bacteroidales bacterium]|nr:glycoside hydrolase family 88 protein [Bacteroidales bacterium]
MKFLISSAFILFTFLTVSCVNKEKPLAQLIDEQLQFAVEQYKAMDPSLPDSVMPRSYNPTENKLITSNSRWWCSGFFPGSLWYLYEYTGDSSLMQMAIKRTEVLEKEKNNRGTHDLGFMLYCSYGNALHSEDNEAYKEVLLTGANSLISRFNPNVKLIKSWDNKKWTYPVIIDNMMNLEFLFWASRVSGDSSYYKIAISHADSTMKNHFRPDFSSWHVVDYDTLTGLPVHKQTAQGFSDESAWARGQSWGLYGFTVMYRETRDPKYLLQAENIASFILNNPNMPEDMIPYWDYNAAGIPNEPRDASAAAILCSGLIELSSFVSPDLNKKYLSAAEIIIRSLSSPEYRANAGENGNFILMHSVGSKPSNSEVDMPQTYADYYFIESLLRLKKAIGN